MDKILASIARVKSVGDKSGGKGGAEAGTEEIYGRNSCCCGHRSVRAVASGLATLWNHLGSFSNPSAHGMSQTNSGGATWT